ncbi:MAG: DNA translocase FtsK [Verrucomicrobiales bacterium]|nr:DNA translocase FtsK [Verrucomicrobiales bacterium]
MPATDPKVRIISKVAMRTLLKKLVSILEDDPFPGCFWILSGFTPDQIAEFVLASSGVSSIAAKLHIELPRGTFQGVVADSYLVDHSAVHTRSLERTGRIILTVDSEGDVGTSLNHKDTISADALKASDETAEDWYEVVCAELGATISETTRKHIIALIRGVFDVGYFGIEAAADYILSVVSTVNDGTHITKAAGLNLPKLGLPKYEDCFKALVDKKLGYKSQWAEKFEQHQKNASYLARRQPSGLLLDPDELLKSLDKYRDQAASGEIAVSDELLQAFAEYANAEPSDQAPAQTLFFEHDWSDAKKFFDKASPKSSIRKFVEETRKALSHRNLQPSEEENALLEELESKTSRKSGSSSEDEKLFFETFEDVIADHNPKLAAEWQDYVYEKSATCTDFIAGLFDCVRRRLQGFTLGNQCKVVIEGVRQSSIADFRVFDADVCTYFERHYGKLEELTGGRVSFAGEGTGKKRTLLPDFRAKVKSELKFSGGKKKSKTARSLEFRVTIHERAPNQKDWALVASIPLIWRFPGDSVPVQESSDLDAIIKHASMANRTALVKSVANYASVGKTGVPHNISLEDTQGFAPSPGGNISGRFIPSPSKIETIDAKILALLAEAESDNKLPPEAAKTIKLALADLSKAAKAALSAYGSSALNLTPIPEYSTAYREVHQQIASIGNDFLRKRLLEEFWHFGSVTIEESNRRPTISIICPWHPLRMEAHRARVVQLTRRLTEILTPVALQFSDDRKGSLFIKDVKELCESPLLPDLTLAWSKLDAKLMSHSSHFGNYSIHQAEDGKNIHAEAQATAEDAREATQVIIEEVDDYLRLQPHERDNLAILLYNCRSSELPSMLVEEFNKRNRDPKCDKVNCEILLTNRNERQLQSVYQELVADAPNSTADERDNDFLSRVRINISAVGSVGPSRRTKRCKPTDIAFCRDLLSKESRIAWEWTGKEGSIVPADDLIPHQWQRMLPFKEGNRVAQIYLTCPAQTASGWSYIHNLGFACEPQMVKKGWEAGWLVLPVRSLNFDSEDVSRTIRETHDLGVWVVNQDQLLDRRLLEDKDIRVIRYVQNTSIGRNTVISSTARDTLLVATIKEILRNILIGDPPEEQLDGFVKQFMHQANAISGRLILRAARRSNNTKELIGVVLSKFLIESQIGTDGKDCWFLLDDYCHWLGKRDGSRLADLLVLSPGERDGRPHLEIVVTEAKFVTPEIVNLEKSDSESQLLDTLLQMARALSADPRPLDQDLWLSRLADMLLSRTIRSSRNGAVIPEYWRALIRSRQCTFSITGYSHVFAHLPGEQVVSQHKGIATKIHDVQAHQEVFNFEATRDIIVHMLEKTPSKTLILRNQLGHPKFAPLKAIDLRLTSDEEAARAQERSHHFPPETVKAKDFTQSAPESAPEPELEDKSTCAMSGNPEEPPTEEPPIIPSTELDPVLSFLGVRAALHTASAKDDQEWLMKTVFNLKSALHRHGMSAKPVEGKSPILTPNAALIRLQGGPDLTLSQIEKRADELYTTDGLKILSLFPGERMISVSVERPDRQVLHTVNVFADLMKDQVSHGERVFIGIREEDGDPMFIDPFANPHTLIAGATGSGKSVLIQNMLLHIALTRSPDQSHIYLIDGKSGIDYMPLRHLPHVKAGGGSIIDTKEGSIEVLGGLVEEMERRYQLFKEAEAKNINHYRAKTAIYLPTLWVIHDEFAEWMEDDDYASNVDSLVNRLSQKSRAAGIFMMFCAQRPDNTVMPLQLRSQLANRLVLKVSDPGTAEIATGEKNSRAEQLLKHGHMLAKVDSVKVYLQVPYIDTDEEMEPLVSLLNKRYSSPVPEPETTTPQA